MVGWARRVDTIDVVTLFSAQHAVGAHMNPACLCADEGWRNKKVMTTLPMGDDRPCSAHFLYIFILSVSRVSRQEWKSLIYCVRISINWVYQTWCNRYPGCTWVRCRHIRMVEQKLTWVEESASKLFMYLSKTNLEPSVRDTKIKTRHHVMWFFTVYYIFQLDWFPTSFHSPTQWVTLGNVGVKLGT